MAKRTENQYELSKQSGTACNYEVIIMKIRYYYEPVIKIILVISQTDTVTGGRLTPLIFNLLTQMNEK